MFIRTVKKTQMFRQRCTNVVERQHDVAATLMRRCRISCLTREAVLTKAQNESCAKIKEIPQVQ